MTDFYCRHCPTPRFIGTGSGTGTIRLQCKKCGRWQLVVLDEGKQVAQNLVTV